MKQAAAYCRLELGKAGQQKQIRDFFETCAKQENTELIELYADETKNSPHTKNKTQFLRLCADAEAGRFQLLFIRDAIPAAQCIADFTDKLRKIEQQGIQLVFIGKDGRTTQAGNTDFILDMLSELSESKSDQRSQRIRQGKKINAQNGKVPNFIFGYDKPQKDMFHLTINEEQAQVVRQVFDWYVKEGIGANKIAKRLNAQNITTKRGNAWSQVAVCRMLANEIYTGKIISGKQTVVDTKTNQRQKTEKQDQTVTLRPELRIISDQQFKQANQLLKSRKNAFHPEQKQEQKHIFSTLIKCKCCGSSFRRQVRKYKNEYVRWVCTGRNANGADTCPNETAINEDELVAAIRDYFTSLLNARSNVTRMIEREYEKQYNSRGDNEKAYQELLTKMDRLSTQRTKQFELFDEEMISVEQLKQNIEPLDEQLTQLAQQSQKLQKSIEEGKDLHHLIDEAFDGIADVLQSDIVTNSMLGKLIDRIVVDEHQTVDIYLKIFTDLGLNENLLT